LVFPVLDPGFLDIVCNNSIAEIKPVFLGYFGGTQFEFFKFGWIYKGIY
jgi:hypothetical protein